MIIVYRFVNSSGKCDCVVYVEGDDLHASNLSQMLSITLGNIKSLYDEKYDKVSFIKNIILDNILPSDIYIKSNELHFSEEFRAVIVVKFQGSSPVPPYEIVQNLVPDRTKDYPRRPLGFRRMWFRGHRG